MSMPDTESPVAGSELARSLLREISERLDVLARGGQRAAIDLCSLPLAAEDRTELERALGRGDIVAELHIAGRSEVWETAYSGVWWVRHFGAGDAPVVECVEIAAVPEILITHPDDIAAAAARARGQFAAAGARGSMEGSSNGQQ